MKTLLTISLLALFATAHAQTITGRDYITGTINLPGTVQFNRDSVPKRCWGITEDDRTALRLYPSVVEKQKWYDFSTYKFKGEGKRAVWIAYAAAGILHGGREAYHAEPTVLQNIFGGPDDSWIGPMQWKRNYPNNDPTKRHKPNLFNPVRDYYHFAGFTTKTVWIGGAFTIGMGKQPTKYKLLDLIIGALITSGTANLTYNLLR